MEQVEVFKYPGRLVAFDDDNTRVVRGNLAKSQRVWARIFLILRAENTPARVSRMLYKANVQAVLLYGRETWCLDKS